MMTTKLPPLILHPFADTSGPDRLVESSRANLMLQGLLPSGEKSPEDLQRILLDGRYCEIRMLFYVGKDLSRWIEQCLEFVSRNTHYSNLGVKGQSFADFLINHTPEAVELKLKKWGVADYKAIFTRALGLSVMWACAPERQQLTDEFIRNYYRYADHLFHIKQGETPFADLAKTGFDFAVYASGEYSQMLEREWAEI